MEKSSVFIVHGLAPGRQLRGLEIRGGLNKGGDHETRRKRIKGHIGLFGLGGMTRRLERIGQRRRREAWGKCGEGKEVAVMIGKGKGRH